MSLATDLERDEGYRSGLYLDSQALLTFGIGRCLQTNPLTADEWRLLFDNGEISVSLSQGGARRLLASGIRTCEYQCASAFPWWPHLDEGRREVLVMLCYNLGPKKLIGFRNMLAAIGAGDYGIAADELQDSLWFKQVRSRGPRLVNQLRTGVRAE